MRLRSRQRLSRQADFVAMRKEGRRQFAAAFVFSIRLRPLEGGGDLPRFAVVASRRVGKAHVRNRLKRQLRAIFRENQAIFPALADVMVTFRAAATKSTFAELEQAFLSGARRNGYPVPAPASVSTQDPAREKTDPPAAAASDD